MVNISIDWVSEGRNKSDDFGLTPGSDVLYYLRYDLPGLDFMDGHVHIVPMQAVADTMMTLGMADPLEAMEHCVLDRVRLNYVDDTPEPIVPGARIQDLSVQGRAFKESSIQYALAVESEAKIDSWEHTGDALAATVESMPLADPKDMLKELFDLTRPVVGGSKYVEPEKFGGMSNLNKFQDVFSERAQIKGALTEAVADHALDKSAAGWRDLENIFALPSRVSLVEEEQYRVFETRYGDALKLIIGERARNEKV